MTPDLANPITSGLTELAGGDHDLALAVAPQLTRPARPTVLRRVPARTRPAEAARPRSQALRVSLGALVGSRLLVWMGGVGTVLVLGYGPERGAFDPRGVTSGFGWLGNLLAAPAARWDAAWYLVIAHYGYSPLLGSYTAPRDAFFPLYPLGIRAVSELGVAPLLAGVAISLAALSAALYLLYRIVVMELGERQMDTARLAVLLCAFAPMGFFLSAVYSESLYLALSLGVFLCARRGRWMWVGVLGALAAATRSAGLLLIVPALWLYLYGPRQDRAPDRDPLTLTGLARALPRYRLRGDVAWLLLVGAGVAAFGAYLGLSGGSVLAPFHSQEVWGRHFAGPFVGAWDGLRAAFESARQLISMQRAHSYLPAGGGDPTIAAEHNLVLFAFLALAVPALIGTFRRLPPAYGLYTLAALALPLSYPVATQPLMSLPRFLLVLFPLPIWWAMWLEGKPRLRVGALVLSAALMVFFGAEFTTWHWVA